MLKRFLTAVPLIFLVLAALLFTSERGFAILSGLVFLYAAYEWGTLIQLRPLFRGILIFVTLLLFILSRWTHPFMLIAVSACWWLSVPTLLYRFNRYSDQSQLANYPFIQAFLAVFILLSAWVSLNLTRSFPFGGILVLFNFFLVWGSDTAAYFVGKRWGKRRLAPGISPKKTLEGLAAALIASLIIAIIEALYLRLPMIAFLKFCILGTLTGCICVIGDLFESMIKRIYKVKDSGTILPGHGGLLDRIDGLLAAAPFFSLGLLWLILV